MWRRQFVESVNHSLSEDWTDVRWGAMFARCGGVHIPQTPVVLVHGFVVSSRYMVPTAQELSALCPVYAVDLPGFGRSCKPARALSFAELADSLHEWLAAKGMERVHLLGNSMGCQIIAEYAMRHPERIDHVVLQGPTVDRHARAFWPQLWRQVQNSFLESGHMTTVLAKDFADIGLPRAVATLKEVLTDPIEEKLPRMEMPVMVVVGSKDPICPAPWAAEVAALLPNAQFVVIPGATHTVNYSLPRELVRIVRPFLAL